MFSLLLRIRIGNGKNKTLAIEYYKKAANWGDFEAEYYLGLHYYHDTLSGNPKSYEVAVILYRNSSEKGYIKATNALGRCYETGVGVKKDIYKAKELYKIAAKNGNASSQYNLALLYYKQLLHCASSLNPLGNFLKRENDLINKIKIWCIQAIAQKHKKASFLLEKILKF